MRDRRQLIMVVIKACGHGGCQSGRWSINTAMSQWSPGAVHRKSWIPCGIDTRSSLLVVSPGSSHQSGFIDRDLAKGDRSDNWVRVRTVRSHGEAAASTGRSDFGRCGHAQRSSGLEASGWVSWTVVGAVLVKAFVHFIVLVCRHPFQFSQRYITLPYPGNRYSCQYKLSNPRTQESLLLAALN